MLDVKKVQEFAQKMNETLAVPEVKGTWNPITLVKNFIDGRHGDSLFKVMEKVSKIRPEFLTLINDLDSSVSSAKTVRAAHRELTGLLSDLKGDLKDSLTKVRDNTRDLRRVLGINAYTLKGLSREEQTKMLSQLLNKLDKEETRTVKRICRRISAALKEAQEPLLDAKVVVNVAENLNQQLRSGLAERGLDLKDRSVASAFQDAVSSALTGFARALASIRASGVREQDLSDEMVQAAEKAVKEYSASLDSKVAVVKAEPMMKEIAELSEYLTNGTRNLAAIPDRKVIVTIPPSTRAKLLARLDAEIPVAERTAMTDALVALSSTTASTAAKQAATDLIKEKFAGIYDKLQQIKKVEQAVCKELADVIGSRVKVGGSTAARLVGNPLQQRPLRVYAEALKTHVETDMLIDCAAAPDILLATDEIDTKCAAIERTFVSEAVKKLDSLVGEATTPLADIEKRCSEVVTKAMGLIDKDQIATRFPQGQDAAARAKALDELEQALKKALA
jgi:hypothetical protein